MPSHLFVKILIRLSKQFPFFEGIKLKNLFNVYTLDIQLCQVTGVAELHRIVENIYIRIHYLPLKVYGVSLFS